MVPEKKYQDLLHKLQLLEKEHHLLKEQMQLSQSVAACLLISLSIVVYNGMAGRGYWRTHPLNAISSLLLYLPLVVFFIVLSRKQQ